MKIASIGIAVVCAATTLYSLKQPVIDVSFFAKENGFLQSQAVQFYHRINETAQASSEEMTAKKLEELKGNEFVELQDQEGFGLAKDRHLFIIQVESLQEFVIGKSLNGEEITPNLNGLLNESAYFSNVFQQIGAGTTSDAEWLVNTGLYPEGMIPTVNSLNGKKVPSLAGTLQQAAYGSATYHADEVEFWNRDVLYPVLGYDEVFSSEQIPAEKEVGFGPADEVLFDFALSQLPRQLETYDRMYSNIVTVTSHTPFKLPEEMQYLDLPSSYEDTYTGNYLQSVSYVDKQIGEYIQELKKNGLYDQSLIVILGDHSGVNGSLVTKEDEELLANFIGHSYTMKDRFTVPLIFTGGGLFDGIEMKRLGGQVDVMPTILALLGIDHQSPMMGHNLFQYEKNLLGMRYYLPGGSYITGDHMYLGQNARYPERYYDFDTMERIEPDKETIEQKQENALKILNHSDALLSNFLDEGEEETETGEES